SDIPRMGACAARRIRCPTGNWVFLNGGRMASTVSDKPKARSSGAAKSGVGKNGAAKNGAAKRGAKNGAGGKHPQAARQVFEIDRASEPFCYELLRAMRAIEQGDFSVRITADATGLAAQLAESFNEIAALKELMVGEFERIANVVGREGRISQRAALGNVAGSWLSYVNTINGLVTDLTQPIAETGRVLGAVARGDLSQRMTLDVEGRPLKGEFLRSARTINTMVDQLNAFASEVTRVAREVGTEGKLGGQADVKGVAGTWKDLTESVNSMAGNLTNQVRNIAEVTTAVADGDLSKKITVEARGEILKLKDTINT